MKITNTLYLVFSLAASAAPLVTRVTDAVEESTNKIHPRGDWLDPDPTYRAPYDYGWQPPKKKSTHWNYPSEAGFNDNYIKLRSAARAWDVMHPILPKIVKIPSPLLPTDDDLVLELYQQSLVAYEDELRTSPRRKEEVKSLRQTKLWQFMKMNNCVSSLGDANYCKEQMKEINRVTWDVFASRFNYLYQGLFDDMKVAGRVILGRQLREFMLKERREMEGSGLNWTWFDPMGANETVNPEAEVIAKLQLGEFIGEDAKERGFESVRGDLTTEDDDGWNERSVEKRGLVPNLFGMRKEDRGEFKFEDEWEVEDVERFEEERKRLEKKKKKADNSVKNAKYWDDEDMNLYSKLMCWASYVERKTDAACVNRFDH